MAIALILSSQAPADAEEPIPPIDVYDAVFVSDAAVCEAAAATDLSNALFEYNASAIVPRHWKLAPEMSCSFDRVESEPSETGEQLYVWAHCQTIDAAYDDFLWIAARAPIDAATSKAGPFGSMIEVSSSHADETMGQATLWPYYRCDDLDPDTVKR